MTTASFQIGGGMSYGELKGRHYVLENQPTATRDQADYDFLIHEYVQVDPMAYKILRDEQEAKVKERDRKYFDRRQYEKIDGSLEAYYKRKNSNANVKHEQNFEFPVVMSVSNKDSYERLVDVINKLELVDGDSEALVRKAYTQGLKNSVEKFNERYQDKGLMFDEYFVHANEDGVPHLHCRMLLDHSDRYGLPSGNMGAWAKTYTKEKTPADGMVKFRKEVDEMVLQQVDLELQALLRSLEYHERMKELDEEEQKVLTNHGDLDRTHGPLYVSQMEYKLAKREEELKVKVETEKAREELLNERESNLEHEVKEQVKVEVEKHLDAYSETRQELEDQSFSILKRQLEIDAEDRRLEEKKDKLAKRETEVEADIEARAEEKYREIVADEIVFFIEQTPTLHNQRWGDLLIEPTKLKFDKERIEDRDVPISFYDTEENTKIVKTQSAKGLKHLFRACIQVGGVLYDRFEKARATIENVIHNAQKALTIEEKRAILNDIDKDVDKLHKNHHIERSKPKPDFDMDF